MQDNETGLPETPAPEAGTEVKTDSVDAVDSTALLASVTAERDQLARERADLYDRLLRLTAEFDNYRRRSQKERAEFAEFAGSEVVREILPVLDDFERALKIETADTDYAKGVELIYTRLLDAAKKSGLEPMTAEGEKFDPNLHHAVEMVPSDEVEDQTIVGEHQRGYKFKGRLLRPAMVKVAVKS